MMAIGQVKTESITALRSGSPSGIPDSNDLTLHIVAFSDTNDLLSWAIPAQYVTAMPGDACLPTLKVANVFVRNSHLLPFLIENPASAHTGYFQNPQVWDVIRCGANNGTLASCQQ